MTRVKPHHATGGEASTATGRLRSAGSRSCLRVSGVAACSASVTGLASTSSGAATRVSSRCWTMWTEKRVVAPASTGDCRATATTARPAMNSTVRARLTAARPWAGVARREPARHNMAVAASSALAAGSNVQPARRRLAMDGVRSQVTRGRGLMAARRGGRVGGGLGWQQELEDAAAAQLAAAGLIEPGKALEDRPEAVGRHARPRVGHGDHDPIPVAPDPEPDLVARAGVLDRVLDQRVQGEPEAVGVADHGGRLDGVQSPATDDRGPALQDGGQEVLDLHR